MQHLFQPFGHMEVPLPGILLRFPRFRDEVSSHALIAKGVPDPVFANTEHRGTVFVSPRGDYSAERRVNDRHLHSALQPELELGGRL